MSPASHMVARLRKLYGVVLAKGRVPRSRRRDRTAPNTPNCPVLEGLEPRLLLSGTVSVSGWMWYDANGDGVRQAEDSGIAETTVTLMTEAGATAETTATASDGQYRFENLEVGQPYYLVFAKDYSGLFTLRDQGGDDTRDSDVDPATGRTDVFVVDAEQANVTFDAGLIPGSSVYGTVFEDVDGNQAQNGAELGVAGWLVYLDADSNGRMDPGEPSATTRSDGWYEISNLRPGTYEVRLAARNRWAVTTPNGDHESVTVGLGRYVYADDFGVQTAVTSYPVTPVGGEFQVSAAAGPTEEIRLPSVAENGAGDVVVAWVVPSGNTAGVYARRYDAAGEAQGGEIQVAGRPDSTYYACSAAMDDAGNFVVTWLGYDQSILPQVLAAQAGPSEGVYAQRYSAAGEVQGDVITVASDDDYTFGYEMNLSVSMGGDGDFVVAWCAYDYEASQYGVYAQQYGAAGDAQGPALAIATLDLAYYDYYYGSGVSVDMTGDGGFVVAWDDGYRGTGYGDIHAQRYDAAGQVKGPALEVAANSDPYYYYYWSILSIDTGTDGEFVIAWQSSGTVYARRYAADGEAQGGGWEIANGYSPSVRMGPDGGFAVAFFDGNYNVLFRRYDAADRPIGEAVKVNSLTSYATVCPSIGVDAAGHFFVAWADYVYLGHYPEYMYSVQAQRYAAVADPVSVSGRMWYDANGDGVRQANEDWWSGGHVTLMTGAGVMAGAATTGQDGRYRFGSLEAGQPYYLVFSNDSGYLITYRDQGGDDTHDSDADLTTGQTDVFVVNAGQPDLTYDAGLVWPSAICGTVFVDADGNGQQDQAEVGMAGWIVYLDANVNGQMDPREQSCTTTSVDGWYYLPNLRPGTYQVGLAPRNRWSATTPGGGQQSVTVGAGQDVYAGGFGVRTTTTGRPASPAGEEFRANTTPAGDQQLPAVAENDEGDTVVAWLVSSGSDAGIYAQRYNAAGEAQGGEIQVASGPADYYYWCSAAMDNAGNFVVAWRSQDQITGSFGVYAQRYDAAGDAQGTALPVGDTSAYDYYRAGLSVGMSGDGRFVVAWGTYDDVTGQSGIYAQRYSSSGEALGAVQTVAAGYDYYYFYYYDNSLSVDATNDGGYVVAWGSYEYVTDQSGVYAQRYDADGNAQGPLLTVAPDYYPDFYDWGNHVSVDVNSDGEFVIAWGTYRDIEVQRYSADGQAQGGAWNAGYGYTSTIRMDRDGGFVIASVDGNGNAYVQQYDEADRPVGEAQLANSNHSVAYWGGPSIGMDAAGNFLVAWSGYDLESGDYGIYARRFQVSAPANVRPTVAVGADATIVKREAFERTGSFVDPDDGDTWTATVNYGDGTGDFPVTLSADKTFTLRHTFAAAGTYAVQVTVQDSAGAAGRDALSLRVLEALPPRILSQTPSGDQTEPVSSVVVTFDQPIDPTTFTAADIVLQGPSGPVPITADPVPEGENSYRITFPSQDAYGVYQLLVGPDIRNSDGNQMDQDGDRVPGEPTDDCYWGEFTILDVTGPRAIQYSPQGPMQGPLDYIDLTFSEAMRAGSFDPTDVSILGPAGQVPVISVTPVSGTVFRVAFALQSAEGAYRITVGPNVSDLAGNLMDQDQDGQRARPSTTDTSRRSRSTRPAHGSRATPSAAFRPRLCGPSK